MIDICEFEIPGIKLVIPKRFNDLRGYFSETWSDRLFRREIADVTFVQDNQSGSAKKGTLRGMHFQKPPFTQGKLIRVIRGSVFAVAVDLRKGSPTYRKHVRTELDGLEGTQLWVPPGFLHGFCTLEDSTEVFYKVTAYYSAAHDAGVLWSDPDLAIDWPVDFASATVSEKDQRLPRLRDLPDFFEFGQ
jgi:dTDP-4-dehydrorhamnose 3,5-epimerase